MHHHPARAMYDQLENTLSSITLQLRSAIEADAGKASREIETALPAGGAPQRSSGWDRQVSAELGSILLESLGLAGTIEWHVRQFQKCTGIPCELTMTAMAGIELPVNCADTIFDIYSEALSNIARHARASRITIALSITWREVTLVVRDNGIGLGVFGLGANDLGVNNLGVDNLGVNNRGVNNHGEDTSRPIRGGIAGMQARARIHKGFCDLASAQSGGTTVTVSLPIQRT